MYPGVSPDITHTHIYILICVLVHTTWTAFILNIFLSVLESVQKIC